MRTLLSIILIVGATVVFAVAGLHVVHTMAPLAWFEANNAVVGNYLQTLGTIYAVLMAFVVFVVWQQHNDARDAVEREGNELADLDRILNGLAGPVLGQVRQHEQAYIQAVLEEEWISMLHGQASKRAEQELEEIWLALEKNEPQTDREQILFGEALARYNDLNDARTHRLLCSRLRLPGTMWAFLLVGGVLNIGSMWLFGMESLAAHALITAALAGSISFVLYLVADLDNPFWGDWKVGVEPIQQALNRGEPSSGNQGLPPV
jgi:hypothetical protein